MKYLKINKIQILKKLLLSKKKSNTKIMQKKKKWNVTKELIGKKTRKSEPHSLGKLLINEHEISRKEEIVDEFNTFFHKYGPKVGKKKKPNDNKILSSLLNL